MAVTTEDFVTGRMSLSQLMKFYSEQVLPEYQRDYSWEEEQVNKLITDIEVLSEDNKNTLFLGQFVFANKSSRDILPSISEPTPFRGGKVEIIDGQQRLTTLTLMYHVILSVVCSRYHPMQEDAKYYNRSSLRTTYDFENTDLGEMKRQCFQALMNYEIQNTILKEDAGFTPIDEFKLAKQVKFNNHKHKKLWKIIFNNSCNHEINVKEFDEQSHTKSLGEELLRDAYEKIYKHINGLDEEEFFTNWVCNFFNLTPRNKSQKRNRIHAAIMHSSNPTSGIEIFYGINALGKQLNPADLIKAAIYNYAKKHSSAGTDRTSDYMHKWEDLENKLVNAFSGKDTSQFISFLVTWITADTGSETRAERLFDAFNPSQRFKSRTDIDVMFQRLEAESDLYLILRKRGVHKFTEKHIESEEARNKLNMLLLRIHLFLGPSAKQHLPILMACFSKLRHNAKSGSLSYIKDENINYLIKITDLVFKIMARFKMADVEAKTLRVSLMQILNRLKAVSTADGKPMYETILKYAKKDVRFDELHNSELGICDGVSNKPQTVSLPMVRNEKIIETLSVPYTMRPKSKFVVIFKNLLWEMEYYLETDKTKRARLMIKDNHDYTVAERSKHHGDHICPDKSDQFWKPHYSAAAYDGLLANKYSIGNFMLLFGQDNVESQNRELSYKIEHIYETGKQVHKFVISKLFDEKLIESSRGVINTLNKKSIDKFWNKDRIEDLKNWYLENILKQWDY